MKEKLDKAAVKEDTGNKSAATNTGYSGVALNWGVEGKAKGSVGCYIALAEWIWIDKRSEWKLKTAKMIKVDGAKIKADTFYKLECGKFIECD